MQKWNSTPELHIFAKMELQVKRAIEEEARASLSEFRALCITGPRQSGKTTLAKKLFPSKPYVNFENPDIELEARSNPRKFLNNFASGAIFDEIQRVPDLFRYLQEILDTSKKRGQFILTGSNNFLLQEKVSQSLAGRVGYLTLLPLSYAELSSEHRAFAVNKHILMGGYPEIWQQNLDPSRWLGSYIQTYVQRDVRLIRNISDLALFNRFIQSLAPIAGQLLNRDELARRIGVDTKTIQAWLGLLEASHIIFMLQPWHNNLNKRIIKSPKLFFHDSGLLCYLLQIKSENTLSKHQQYGAIFENWVISEIVKNRENSGRKGGIYFFRDSSGNEVDVIIEKETGPLAIEIKSSRRLTSDSFSGLKYWKKYQPQSSAILLSKSEDDEHSGFTAMHWSEIGEIG